MLLLIGMVSSVGGSIVKSAGLQGIVPVIFFSFPCAETWNGTSLLLRQTVQEAQPVAWDAFESLPLHFRPVNCDLNRRRSMASGNKLKL